MSILGVIGIILLNLLKVILIIFLILLLLILLVLFLPIGYEATGKADGAQGISGITIHARVRAFLGLVRFSAGLQEGELKYSLKAAGFSLKKGRKVLKPESPGPEEQAEMPEEPVPDARTEEAETPPRQETAETAEQKGQEKPPASEQPQEAPEKKAEEKQDPDQTAPLSAEPEKKSFQLPQLDLADKISTGLERASDGAYAARGSLDAAWDKAVSLWDKALGMFDELMSEGNIRAVTRVKNAVFRILKHLAPDIFKARGVIGTGDPALTGQILSIFYMLYPLYADRWELELAGEFTEKKILGKFYVKGKIIPGAIVATVLFLLRDRVIRRLVFKKLFHKGK